jgi:DNA-binding IclR family transcriptional regulator
MSHQLNFLDAKALARTSDHDSSHAAADRAEQSGLVDSHEHRILRALCASKRAMTSEDLAHWTGLSVVQVCRRTKSMTERGSIAVDAEGKRLRWYVR